MIDRISRNFVSYSAYRNRMQSELAVSNSYIMRENVSLHNMNGRAVQMRSYHRGELENTLMASPELKARMAVHYPLYSRLGYVPGQIQTQAISPYHGQYVDTVI
jgi:hypothetical protein